MVELIPAITLGGLAAVGAVAAVISFRRNDDPVFQCDVNKNVGCVHVDGMLCDYPKCTMFAQYRGELKIG